MTILYVSKAAANGIPVGSDSHGTGSLASPYQTLDKAIAAARNGDEIRLNDGDYRRSSTLMLSKSLTIDSVTSFGATITAAGGSSSILRVTNGSTLTCKDITLDANRTAASCISVADQAKDVGVRLIGTKLLNARVDGIDGGETATAARITANGASFVADHAASFIALHNLRAGAVKALHDSVTITNQAGGAGGVVDVTASAKGPTVEVSGVKASITGAGDTVRSLRTRHYGVLVANVANVDVEKSDITVTDSAKNATAVPVCVWTTNTSPLDASGAVIRGNTLRSFAAGGGMVIQVGFDGDPGASLRGLADDAEIEGNLCIGNAASQAAGLHGIYVGWQEGSDVSGNTTQDVAFAYCMKGDFGTNEVHGNRDIDTSNKVFYQKGGTGVQDFDNSSVEGAGFNPWAIFVGPCPLRNGQTQNAVGGRAFDNTFSSDAAVPRGANIVAGSSEDLSGNAYQLGSGTTQGDWVSDGVTYRTLSAWQAAVEPSASGHLPITPKAAQIEALAPARKGAAGFASLLASDRQSRLDTGSAEQTFVYRDNAHGIGRHTDTLIPTDGWASTTFDFTGAFGSETVADLGKKLTGAAHGSAGLQSPLTQFMAAAHDGEGDGIIGLSAANPFNIAGGSGATAFSQLSDLC